MSEPQIRTDPNGFARIFIDPMDNIIKGSGNILKYMGLNSIVTLYEWVELYGFPAIKRPDGVWTTSITAIDQWIFLAAEVDLENRPKSRGSSRRGDKAIAHAERTFGEDSPQAKLAHKSHDHFTPELRPATVAEGRPSRAKAGGKSGLLKKLEA